LKALVDLLYIFLFEILLIQIYWFEINTSGLGKREREKVMLIGRVTKAGSLPLL